MAQYRTPNYICQGTKSRDIEDGTTMRTSMCAPGLVDRWHLREFDRRVGYVKKAWHLASDKYVMRSIIDRCGRDFYEACKDMLPLLAVGLGTLIVSTIIGITVGSAMGVLVGGITALPGAVMGGKIGFFAGSWMLNVFGLTFLTELVQSRLNEVGEPLRMGLYRAWKSEGSKREVEDAANEMAEAVGRFFEILQQAITVYVTRASQRGSMQTAMQQLRNSRLFRVCPRLESWLVEFYPEMRKKVYPSLDFRVLAEGPKQKGSSIPEWIRIRIRDRVYHVERNASKLGPGQKPIGPAMKHLHESAGDNPWSKIYEVDFPMMALAAALEQAETDLLFKPPSAQAKPKVDGWELLIDTRSREWKVYHALPTAKPKW